MKSVNASSLNRKSGVRSGERGALVHFLLVWLVGYGVIHRKLRSL